MRKLAIPTGCSLTVATQILATLALGAESLPMITAHGLHLKSITDPTERVSRPLNALHDQTRDVDAACAQQQINEVIEAQKQLGMLKVDEVVIHIRYGNERFLKSDHNENTYAEVLTKPAYRFPVFNMHAGERKILDIGTSLPDMPNGKSPGKCSITSAATLVGALSKPRSAVQKRVPSSGGSSSAETLSESESSAEAISGSAF
jgi:hypothetical protein